MMMNKLNRKDWILGISIALAYIAVGVFTLKGYGAVIDSRLCFGAGDAYQQFFLGKISLPNLANQLGEVRFDPPFLYIVESIPWLLFPVARGVYWDPLMGVRYTESWLISHSLLILVFAGLALLVVYYFTQKAFGRFAGVSATLSLVFLPVFFGLAHLDMKDLPFATLYGLTIILFWKGVSEKNLKWVTSSSIFFGLTLASRPMGFIVLFVLYGWLLLTQLHKFHLKSKLTISLLLYPIIGGVVFFLAWPWLWLDPINNLLASLRFFQDRHEAVLYFGKILYTEKNLPWHYAIVTLAITTPIPILIFALVGGISAFKRSWSLRGEASILVLLWFGVSIIRSSLTSIFPVYNGTRLFTEIFLPLCILAGLGASWIYTYIHSHINISNLQNLVKAFSAILIISLITVPGFIAMYQIHPYEMSYYNELVGGVKGAYGKFDVDYWLQAYAEGAIWLNGHAIRNAIILIVPSSSWSTFYFTRSDLQVYDWTYFQSHVDYTMFSPSYYPSIHNPVVVFCLQNLKPAYVISIEGAPALYIYDTTSFDITQMPGAPITP
jgi:4-amino-4-deoxy-L-arabinose transferase-like glycosyltransferase